MWHAPLPLTSRWQNFTEQVLAGWLLCFLSISVTGIRFLDFSFFIIFFLPLMWFYVEFLRLESGFSHESRRNLHVLWLCLSRLECFQSWKADQCRKVTRNVSRNLLSTASAQNSLQHWQVSNREFRMCLVNITLSVASDSTPLMICSFSWDGVSWRFTFTK